jgi:hypothetical protein
MWRAIYARYLAVVEDEARQLPSGFREVGGLWGTVSEGIVYALANSPILGILPSAGKGVKVFCPMLVFLSIHS